jgi:hypothetical protein
MESAVCPITLEIMSDPVVAADGHTYEREALLRWLKGSNNSPATGAPLANRTIIPNYCVKMLIRELHQPHAREILWLWRIWHAGWWVLSNVPAALGRAGLAVLLLLKVSDAPEWPVSGRSSSSHADFAGMAALAGGGLFCLATLVADEPTRVVSCALLCTCCFSCGLMASPPAGPTDEVLQLSRLLLLSGCALCSLGMYLMHASETPKAEAAATPELIELPVPRSPGATMPAPAVAPLAQEHGPGPTDPRILETLAQWRVDLAQLRAETTHVTRVLGTRYRSIHSRGRAQPPAWRP